MEWQSQLFVLSSTDYEAPGKLPIIIKYPDYSCRFVHHEILMREHGGQEYNSEDTSSILLCGTTPKLLTTATDAKLA